MEQEIVNKPKSNALPWILCTVFALVAIGLGVFLVLGGIKKEDNKTNCVTAADNQGNSAEADDKKATAATGFVKDVEFATLYVTKNGEVYLHPASYTFTKGSDRFNGVKIDSNYEPGTYGKYKITDSDIIGAEFRDFDAPKSDPNEAEFQGYKLDLTNIVSVYSVGFGQAWNGWNIALVDRDGNMNWLHAEPSGNSTVKTKLIKNIEKYKNVAALMSTVGNDGGYVTIVTKDGGHIEISAEDLISWDRV